MLIDVTNCSIQSFWYHNQIESTFADLKRSREISQDGVWASALDLLVAVHRISDADRLSGRNLYLWESLPKNVAHSSRERTICAPALATAYLWKYKPPNWAVYKKRFYKRERRGSLSGFLIIAAFGDTLQNRIVGIITSQRIPQ